MKTHLARYESEFRGRYRFIFCAVFCLNTLHMIGDGLRVTTKKKEVTCKNCKRMRQFRQL